MTRGSRSRASNLLSVTRGTGPYPFKLLNVRESQVFSMLVEGVWPKVIGYRLEISPKTVDRYRASLTRKLRVTSVAALVKLQLQHERREAEAEPLSRAASANGK